MAKQIAFIKDLFVAVAIDSPLGSRITLFEVDDINNPFVNESVNTTTKTVLLKSRADFNTVIIEFVDNRVVELDSTLDCKEIVKFLNYVVILKFLLKKILNNMKLLGFLEMGNYFVMKTMLLVVSHH